MMVKYASSKDDSTIRNSLRSIWLEGGTGVVLDTIKYVKIIRFTKPLFFLSLNYGFIRNGIRILLCERELVTDAYYMKSTGEERMMKISSEKGLLNVRGDP